MATYKVIQDIEAEDKFVGPLTLKQFIFAMGGGLFGYLSFFAVTRGFIWALAITLPPCLLGFFMAIPWSKDQSTDVWVLAKLRFRLKPRKRVWNQDGAQDLVTITAPKKEEKPLTNNLSETEVKSRLKALAETIDSRGWVVKHAEFQKRAATVINSDERLLTPDELPSELEVPEIDQAAVPDVLEGQPKIDNLIRKSEKEHRKRVIENMERIRQGEGLKGSQAEASIVAPPEEEINEKAIEARLKVQRATKNIGLNNMHSISATNNEAPDGIANTPTEVEKAQASMTEQVSPDILKASGDNNQNIKAATEPTKPIEDNKEPDEVVISLH